MNKNKQSLTSLIVNVFLNEIKGFLAKNEPRKSPSNEEMEKINECLKHRSQILEAIEENDDIKVQNLLSDLPKNKFFFNLLEECIHKSCSSGQVKLVKCFLTFLKDQENLVNLSVGFHRACRWGHLEVVKSLLHHLPPPNIFFDWHDYNEYGFREACNYGHLDIVKYLLTSPELIEAGHTFADLHALRDEGLSLACENGHLNVVKYLLTSPELIEAGHTFADLHADNELGIRSACSNGQLEIIKYLLTAPELIKAGHTFANVHAANDFGFCRACEYEHWNVVRWLVMDYRIEKTSIIEEVIREYPQVQEYFRVRDEIQEIERSMHLTSLQDHENSSSMLDLKDERAAKKAKKL